VKAHDEWKNAQEGDVVRNMEVLRQQLVESNSVQDAKLKSLQEEGKNIDENLQLVVTPLLSPRTPRQPLTFTTS